MKKLYYSIILPVRNEAKSLPRLTHEINKVMRRKRYSLILVDDASHDHPLKCTIRLPYHMGKWEAIRAGLSRARGQIIIIMDADLQDDPKEIPRLIKKLQAGYDIVSGWRKTRHDQQYKIMLTKFANLVVSWATGYRFRDFSSPMKVYTKEALDTLPKEGSFLRYSLLLAHLLGIRTAEIPVVHHPRVYGQSKFGLLKYFRIFYDVTLILLLFNGSGRLIYRKS